MTQFAYPITVGVVEFFNLLGTVVPNVIFGFIPIVEPGTTLSGTGGIAQGLGTALVFTQAPSILSTIFIIFILLAIVALIAVIISFVFLTIRLIIIYILILLAPLAFASWVLPGTEKFFTNWWKNFIRLNAMFPMITGLLAVSILLSKIFLSIGGG
jgi:type IV secretory pathway VirB6-like protein